MGADSDLSNTWLTVQIINVLAEQWQFQVRMRCYLSYAEACRVQRFSLK